MDISNEKISGLDVNDNIYTGSPDITEIDRTFRKSIGLPITKQLVYYSNKRDASSVLNVNRIWIVKKYNISDIWYTFKIELENNDIVFIHSSYFADMQKSDFVSKIKLQDSSLE